MSNSDKLYVPLLPNLSTMIDVCIIRVANIGLTRTVVGSVSDHIGHFYTVVTLR